MHGTRKTARMKRRKWGPYALPKGFAERGYLKDSSYHMTSRNMMGCKNPDYSYQTTFKEYKYLEVKSNGNAKLSATPHRRNTVLVKHATRRFYRKLGRARESIHEKFTFHVQTTSINRRSQILYAEKRRSITFTHTKMEYNKKTRQKTSPTSEQ
jgi:hypothetical protein